MDASPEEDSDRVLVLGAAGLLGYPTWLEARERWGETVQGSIRRPHPALEAGDLHTLDLRSAEDVTALLRKLRPRCVLNCAGMVKARAGESYDTILLNAALPHLLAETLASWGGRLVQVSTDCVFSGNRGDYRENDPPDAEDLYGRSKLLGEVTEAPHLTVRTSFVGFELASRRGLLAWFLSQAGPVRGFRRALWSGLTADRLAAILVELAGRRKVTGLLHVAGETVDKDHLLRIFQEVFDHRAVSIEAVDEPRLDRSLASERLRELGISVPPLETMLRDLAAWRERHPHVGTVP